MYETVANKLKKLIVQELYVNLKLENIDDNAPLFEDGLGIDSLALVELITLIEEHFKFEFADSDIRAETFVSLNSLANLVVSKIKPDNTLVV
ncbi:acyl carrier protein [Moorena producens PAL-8-15-08-1]|uniref:Acyl carrier protein n=1 Tax=Moorena producens PAL-8-15-08-1 TaxID=1458985 RepID=A0A1D8TQ67_9CYAN|nr:phosphopantetheine-binding protein [Moorena producens]AOW99787.1 acyl carrier protein [Moorena producens PAL-8-15-08-1]